MRKINRRQFLTATALFTTGALAGCTDLGGSGGDGETTTTENKPMGGTTTDSMNETEMMNETESMSKTTMTEMMNETETEMMNETTTESMGESEN